MKTLILKCARFTFVLLSSSLLGFGQQALVSLPKPVSDEEFILSGVIFETGTPLASISGPNRKEYPKWVKESEQLGSFQVKKISLHSVTLKDMRNDKEITIWMSGAQTTGAVAMAKHFSRAWINSYENPMLLMPQPLHISVQRNWVNMTDEEKTKLLEFYRNHGWQLISASVVAGSVTFAWENIYNEERRAALKANKVAFEAMLTPELKAKYQAITEAQPIYAIRGSITPEQEAEAARRRAAVSDFTKSLSTPQQEAMAATKDFTKGKW